MYDIYGKGPVPIFSQGPHTLVTSSRGFS